MKKQAIQYNAKQMRTMIEKGNLSLTSPIQRRPGQWDNMKASLLIHSMLSDYIVPPIYFSKVDTGNVNEKGRPVYQCEVIDGVQRLSTIFSFINDEFELNANTPTAEVDDETVELAGKKFSDLSDDVQEEIKRFNFTVYNLEDFTDEEIEEIFFRLNNGVSLTKGQQSKAKLGLELSGFINEILSREFFTTIAHFTALQYRRSADQLTLMQSMMLLDHKYNGYEFKSISESDILTYAESIRGKYSDEQRERIVKIVDYLEDAFDEHDKFMKKINIPMVFVVADYAITSGIDRADFYNWFNEFSDSYSADCEYAQYCGSGSVKKPSVLERIHIMKDSFIKYVEDCTLYDDEPEKTA